ncbi:MAG: arsenate reductase (azurin) small subunit [Deltaproteobacteria bacterium]|jgi:arsenite oxidase small subunit|nr:arsenate reductase (azurin) small subunit [Deltaproteobacteria bacterium]
MSADIKTVETGAEAEGRPCQVSRRRFLKAAGVGGAGMVLLAVPGCGSMWARTTPLPRQSVGKLADLKVDQPKMITFPDRASMCMIVKLGVPAGGGVGPDGDVVAYSLACSHMGMSLIGTYNAKHKGIGPCPSHLTRFDLTRYGMVVSGHATESLPQVILEVEDNGDIYATGMRGLVYGRTSNAG